MIIEFNDLKVYSDLFLSNNLFLFCVSIFTEVHDLKITVKEFTFLEILISPKGILIDFDLGGYDAFSIAHHIRLDNNPKL